MSKRISRREFLQVSAVTAASVALTACGVTPDPTKVPAASSASSVTSSQASAAATAVPTKAAATAVPKPSLIDITLARYEHPAQPILQDAPTRKVLTDATGVKINFSVVPQADYPAKQKVWLATKQVPDLMQVNTTQIRDYAKPEILKPLSELIDKYGPNLKRFIEANPVIKKTKLEGNLFYIPAIAFNWKRNAPMPMIRKDLVEKAGLKLPETLEDLFTVLKELKKATPTSLGWTMRNGTQWLLCIASLPFGSGYGATQLYFGPYWDRDANKWLFGPIHDEFKDCLDYLAKAYKEGILDSGFANTTTDQWHEKNSSTRGVFTWDNMTFGIRWNTALRGADAKATWTPLPTLGWKKIRRQNDYDGLYDGWAIGAGAKNPDRIIQMLDWLITPVGLDLSNWGIEGTHYTRKAPRPETIADYTSAGVTKAMPATRNEILPAVFEKFKSKADPFRSFHSDTGIGQLDLTQIFDNSSTHIWDPAGEVDAWYQITANDKTLFPRGVQPPFTAAETERLKKVQTDVDAILNPAFDKVILGQMSLSDYDKAVADAKKAGAEDLEKIHNDAEARVK